MKSGEENKSQQDTIFSPFELSKISMKLSEINNNDAECNNKFDNLITIS